MSPARANRTDVVLPSASCSLLCCEDPSSRNKHRLRESLAEVLLWVPKHIQWPQGTIHCVSHIQKTRMELKLTRREEERCFQTTFSDQNPLHPLS